MYISRIPSEYQPVVREGIHRIAMSLPADDSDVADRFLFDWYATLEELLLDLALARDSEEMKQQASRIQHRIDYIVRHNILGL